MMLLLSFDDEVVVDFDFIRLCEEMRKHEVVFDCEMKVLFSEQPIYVLHQGFSIESHAISHESICSSSV